MELRKGYIMNKFKIIISCIICLSIIYGYRYLNMFDYERYNFKCSIVKMVLI